MTEESKDCLQCRLTSGGGLLGAGVYVVYQSKKIKNLSRHIITAIGIGLGIVGILRVFALPPFKTHPEVENKNSTEDSEHQDYIIGKFPTKFQ